MAKLIRLDYTSPYESLVRGLFYLLGGLMLVGVFGLFTSPSESLPWLFLGAPPTLLAGWAAQKVDDTYWLDLERENLLEQRGGLLRRQVEVVRAVSELRAVGVDYRYDTPPFSWWDLLHKGSRAERPQYALAFVTKDGQKILVSDWLVDDYARVSSSAAQVGQWTRLPVVDEGPERELEVFKNAQGVVQVRLKPDNSSGAYVLVGIVIWMSVVLWKMVNGTLFR